MKTFDDMWLLQTQLLYNDEQAIHFRYRKCKVASKIVLCIVLYL